MKKIILLMLILIIPFVMTSCKNNQSQTTTDSIKYNSIQEAAYYTQESVVSISSLTITLSYKAESVGSGTIISTDVNHNFSYILTCFHVIAKTSPNGEITDPEEVDIANILTVTTFDGNEYDAKFVGGSYYQDIAIICIETRDYKPVTIREKSNEVTTGTQVFTFGSPSGLTFSFSQGIVSSTNSINGSYQIDNTTIYYNFFDLDFSVNPGNSGGGLFDINGNIVGMINQKKYSTNGGVYGNGIAIKYYSDSQIYDGVTLKTYDISSLLKKVFDTSKYSFGSWKYESFISY